MQTELLHSNVSAPHTFQPVMQASAARVTHSTPLLSSVVWPLQAARSGVGRPEKDGCGALRHHDGVARWQLSERTAGSRPGTAAASLDSAASQRLLPLAASSACAPLSLLLCLFNGQRRCEAPVMERR